MRRTLNTILVIAIIVVAALLVIPLVTGDDEHETKSKPQTVTTKVDSADPGTAPDKKVVVPKAVLDQVKTTEEHSEPGETGGRDESPPDVPASDLEQGREQQHKFALKDLLPLELPFAAPSQRGCRTLLVANKSSRNGIAPRVIFMHWTGSANVKGWADVNAIVAWFNQARSQASSNYVVDREGHCALMVAEANKAWTQAALNPVGISFEIVHPGGPNEPYCPGACQRKVARIIADASKRWKIPLRIARVSDCRVELSGITDHRAGGPCAGGHPDISSAGFSVVPLIKAARALSGTATPAYRPTATDRLTCRKLNWWRTHGRHHGKAERNAVRRKKALAKRGVACTRRGPLRTR